MKEFTITGKDDGRRLDKWMLAEMPLLSPGMCQKYLRLKRVRINGKVAARDARLATGDVLNIYLNDELFEKPHRTDALLSKFHWHLNIVYEDENILLVDKRPGIMVHGDASEKLNTLVTHVRAYLYQKGEYDSMVEGSFAPAPCNRIDRFTGGIVIFAKNAAAHGTLDNYVLKQEGRRKVIVSDRPLPGAQRAQTRYETLAITQGLSLMDCELLTGRTHQIRAQFAHAGHPLLGDGQYGDPAEGQRFGREYQALYAYRLVFNFNDETQTLGYLNGRSFAVRDVPFVHEYFNV